MKHGQLNASASGLTWTLAHFRGGGKIPAPPDAISDGCMRWNWQNTMLTDIELHLRFAREVFVSLVRLELAPDSVTAAEILVPAEGGLRCVGAHRAETGCTFGGTVKITVGWSASTVMVRLSPALKALEVAEPAVFGALLDTPVLYPTPSPTEWGAGSLSLTALHCAVSDGHPDSDFAVSYLGERAAEQWRVPAGANGSVAFRHTAELVPDGYRLTVTPEGAVVEASTRLGPSASLPCATACADFPLRRAAGQHCRCQQAAGVSRWSCPCSASRGC